MTDSATILESGGVLMGETITASTPGLWPLVLFWTQGQIRMQEREKKCYILTVLMKPLAGSNAEPLKRPTFESCFISVQPLGEGG